MVKYYTHTFSMGGRLIHVPSPDGRVAGEAIANSVKSKWKPPINYYHLRGGGHLRAVKAHLGNRFFLKIDLSDFFGSVTRSKIHRSLCLIGVPHKRALEYASVSTVRRDDVKSPRVLPFGYPQSPLLASLALNKSFLGKVLAGASGLTLSVYMDDVLCSCDSLEALSGFREQCYGAAAASGFQINEKKSGPPSEEIEIFNLSVRQHGVRITDERLVLFAHKLSSASIAAASAINAYIKSATV